MAAGGPDGGDGGRGGDVVFVVDDGANTLADFRYQRKFRAQSGEPGGGKRCSGKTGENCVIKVPRGTLLFDNANGRLMADMSGEEPVSYTHLYSPSRAAAFSDTKHPRPGTE